MTTITKERLLTIKQWRETYGPGSNVVLPAEEAEELARIALASLEAEPIGFRCRRNDNLGDWSYVYHREPDDFERKHLVIEGIYAAPPAPVVPEEKPMPNPLSMYAVDAVAAIAEVRGWNACRAAMLHGAEPASNHEELPLDYLQGQKDGLEWAAQLAEANHPQTGDWLYDDPLELAKAIRKGPDMPEFDGPTPVTQDGWISCSERMPENIPGSCKEYLVFDGLNNKVHHDYWVVPDGDSAPVASFWNHYGAHVTHWMPLPEPPQEVK
ncbi:Eaa protein [Escherichia coli]|nr:Eaa protein [Escherichia coli]PPX32900.1 Eaa protein [Escherichia coli]